MRTTRTMRNRGMAALLMSGTLLAGLSLQARAQTYTNEDGDRVVCREEAVQTRDGHPVAAPLAGAVVGGIVGNQFGSGSGNKAMTAAGAVGGAVAGKKIDENRSQTSVEYRQVCRPVD